MTQFLRWLAMGGYAYYVWSAYAFVFAVLILNLHTTKVQRDRMQKRLQQAIKRPI